jgi:hypothetical protein
MTSSPRIIPLEEGWEKEIKEKVSIKHIIHSVCWRCEIFSGFARWQEHVISYPLTSLVAAIQAIDKLEEILDGGMKSGTTNMFGPKEYVAIYT